MNFSKEQIREDVLSYILKHTSKDIDEISTMSDYKMTDFDLIDMEIELEEKYGYIQDEDDECEIADIHSHDTLIEVINKLFEYFKTR